MATTHQLLRYYQYFDLIIIDEVDAFPYCFDNFLHYAVQQAKAKDGTIVYLSATPNWHLRCQVSQCYKIVARFHQRPLPMPQFIRVNNLTWYLKRATLPTIMINQLKE